MKNITINILTDKYENLFIPDKHVEIDLGCGKGKFSIELAMRNPQIHILAADVMIGRLRKLQNKLNRNNIENVQILRVEATSLLGYFLPDNSIDRIHLLCPDPWPKAKHKGHRLLSSQFIASLKRVLKPNGVFHFASDNEPYYNSVKKLIDASNIFESSDLKLIEDIIDIKTDFQLRWEEEGLTVKHCAFKLLKSP